MNGNGYLIAALTIAAVGIGFYYAGPFFERWHKRLESDLERMRKGH